MTVRTPRPPEQVYTIAGERCDCGEPLDYCFWCDRRTPACPRCGQETPEDTPTCPGVDGACLRQPGNPAGIVIGWVKPIKEES